MTRETLKNHVREGYQRNLSLVFFTLVSITVFSGFLFAADELAEEDGTATESGPLLVSIPPLDRWNDPFAISMKDHISGNPPAVAGDLLVDELIKAAEELTALAKSMKPDYSGYSAQMIPLAKAQWKVRVLMETLQFLASQLPVEQQAAWKAAARTRFASALTAADVALSSNTMMSAAKEIAALGLDFTQPYVNPEELYQRSAEELAPPRPATPNPMGMDGMDDPSMYYDSSDYGGGYGMGGGGNLLNACKAFLRGHSPGPVDDKKMEPLVNALIAPGRTVLQGYAPRGSAGSYGGGGMYDEMGMGMHSPGYNQPPAGTQSSQPTGSLNLGGVTVNTRTGPPRESLDDSVRKSIAFALRQMLRDEETKIGVKIAAAYCAFADQGEDYVPEIALFLERSGETLRDRDFDLLVSLPIGADYARDPRIGFLMTQILFATAPGTTNQNQITDAFSQASSAAQFLVHGLDQPRTRDISLIVLYKIGDGDSAVHVAKLLGNQSFGTEYRISLLEILGQTGDQRVGSAILRCLPDPSLQETAKEALIRIGTPAEAAVVTIFNAKRPAFDLVALEILSKIGSWRSLSTLGRQLAFYSEAKTPTEAARMEEQPKLILEPAVQNELLQKTIEAGTTIVARMTGTNPPNFRNPNATGGGGPGMPGGGMPMPGYGPEYEGGEYGAGFPGSYPGSSSRMQDNKSPRTLAKRGEMNPGNAPVAWMTGLAMAGAVKFDEGTRILSRVSNYDTGRRAGEDMRSLGWVEQYFKVAGAQVKQNCLPLVNADAKRSIESSLSRLETRFKRFDQERNRIGRTNNPRQGFQDGFAPRTQQPAGHGGVM